MTWYEADEYCIYNYKTLIERDDFFEKSWVDSGYSKAWVGLMATFSLWSHQDGRASYFNWSNGQPDNLLAELCVAMTDAGDWYNRNCSEPKHSVCSNGG